MSCCDVMVNGDELNTCSTDVTYSTASKTHQKSKILTSHCTCSDSNCTTVAGRRCSALAPCLAWEGFPGGITPGTKDPSTVCALFMHTSKPPRTTSDGSTTEIKMEPGLHAPLMGIMEGIVRACSTQQSPTRALQIIMV